jgi:hypothetical protein
MKIKNERRKERSRKWNTQKRNKWIMQLRTKLRMKDKRGGMKKYAKNKRRNL